MSENHENISLEDTDSVKLLKEARIPGYLCLCRVAFQKWKNPQSSKCSI